VVSSERRNISAMIRGSTRGGQDGARLVGQRQASESSGPVRDRTPHLGRWDIWDGRGGGGLLDQVDPAFSGAHRRPQAADKGALGASFVAGGTRGDLAWADVWRFPPGDCKAT